MRGVLTCVLWLHACEAYSGRTAAGRLRWVDDYLLLRERESLVARGDKGGGCVVDIGVGDTAETTLELAAALRSLGTRAPVVVGVESDGARASRARVRVEGVAGVRVRQSDGSLSLALRDDERCVAVRAMNVFRSGYKERDIPLALEAIAASLEPSAPLVEGSCSRTGDAGVAHVMRRSGGDGDGGFLRREALLFHIDPERTDGFAPLALRPYLPRDLRFHFKAGSPVYAFFEEWTRAWKTARKAPGARAATPAEVFRRSAAAIRTDDVELLGPGLMLWTPRGGVPVAPVG